MLTLASWLSWLRRLRSVYIVDHCLKNVSSFISSKHITHSMLSWKNYKNKRDITSFGHLYCATTSDPSYYTYLFIHCVSARYTVVWNGSPFKLKCFVCGDTAVSNNLSLIPIMYPILMHIHYHFHLYLLPLLRSFLYKSFRLIVSDHCCIIIVFLIISVCL